MSLGTRLHLLVVVPLLVVTVVVAAITAGGLSSNARRLQAALLVEGEANRAFSLLLVQEDTTKAILIDPNRLPDYAAAKLAAYDEHKALLGRLEGRLTDPQVR